MTSPALHTLMIEARLEDLGIARPGSVPPGARREMTGHQGPPRSSVTWAIQRRFHHFTHRSSRTVAAI